MTKPKSTLKQELIESILNERRHFGMERYMKGHDQTNTANCRTASCMAGHIEALRPKLAKKLLPEFSRTITFSPGDADTYVDHDLLAAEIWRQETGTECRLDFLGDNHSRMGEELDPKDPDSSCYFDLNNITREEAVAHIRGRSKSWPLLPKGKGR